MLQTHIWQDLCFGARNKQENLLFILRVPQITNAAALRRAFQAQRSTDRSSRCLGTSHPGRCLSPNTVT